MDPREEPTALVSPAELEAEYQRALRQHYADGRRGMRTATTTLSFVVMAAIVALLPLWAPARLALGVGVETTLPLALVSALSIVHAAIAYRRGGPESRWNTLAEGIESTCSVGCSMLLIYASGSATSAFWLYLVLFIADAWNNPRHAPVQLALYAAGTLGLALGFVAGGAATDAAITGSLGVLGVASIHAFAASAKQRLRAEAERRCLRVRLEGVLVERERGRIAKDLHDGVAAELSALVWRARELKEALGEGRAAALADSIMADARRSLTELREVVQAQRAASEGWEEVVAELRARVERLCEHALACEVVTVDLPDAAEVPADVRFHLLRIVQEAVRNVVQHAEARAVRVELERGSALSIRVLDDGRGIPEKAFAAPHGGLSNIQERVRDLGGEAVWQRDAGTQLLVTFPLR